MTGKTLLLKLPDPATYITTPPLGLGYIASYLKSKSHEVDFMDMKNDQISEGAFPGILRKNKYEYIGIQLYSYHLPSAKKYSEIIRRELPSAKIVVGGPHASSEPEHTLAYLPDVDFAIMADGEKPFAALLSSGSNPSPEKLKGISNLVYRSNEKIILNPVEVESDLDSLPMPDWELLNPLKYSTAPQGIFLKHNLFAPISVTRGCPYKCTFCAGYRVMGRKIRQRSIDNVLAEIVYLKNRYGIKEVQIIDDNFTYYRSTVEEFCKKIIETGININWSCPNGVRLDTLDKELLQLMEQAGCVYMGLGIESGSNKILKNIKKGLTVEKIIEKTDLIKAHTSINTTGFFLIGFPGEFREDIISTINLAKRVKLDMAAFTIVQPLPGTELYYDWIKRNKVELETLDWDNFFHIGVFKGVSELNEEDLRKLQKKAVREFYFRLHIVVGFIKRIRTFAQLKTIFNRVFTIFIGKG